MDIYMNIKEILEAYKPNYGTLNLIICETYSPTITKGDVHTMKKITITDNVVGRDMTGRISEKVAEGTEEITVSKNEVTNDLLIEIGDFSNDVTKAIEIINSFVDVDKSFRDALVSLVNEANAAVQNRDETAKTSCKDKFKGFLLVAGKAVDKVLGALANVATIATFFGLGK